MDKQEKIVEYLRQKYNPVTVVLHGSRASGKNRSNSDWDFYLFVNQDAEDKYVGIFMGESLDVGIFVLPIISEDFIDEYASSLVSCKILYDVSGGLIENLLREAKERFLQGKSFTEKELNNRKNYLYRTLERLKGNIDRPELFFLYLGYFYESALNYWFEVQNKYSRPAYEALDTIKSTDEEYYSYLTVLFGSGSNLEKVEVAQKIYDKLFGN